jgi:hypothetical protein
MGIVGSGSFELDDFISLNSEEVQAEDEEIPGDLDSSFDQEAFFRDVFFPSLVVSDAPEMSGKEKSQHGLSTLINK